MGTNLLIITCYTGDQSFLDMTNRMVDQLVTSIKVAKSQGSVGQWAISLIAQESGEPKILQSEHPVIFEQWLRNAGFAMGMNVAYQRGIREFPLCDAVMCINNDVEMPRKGWLHELMKEYQEDRVLCPTTDYTGVDEQRALGPVDRPSFDHQVTPAVCWLMSRKITRELEVANGEYKLFPEDLGGRAWGEDTYSAGVLRAHIDPKPFKIVPSSWIKHLGAKTSSKIPVQERLDATREARKRLEEL